MFWKECFDFIDHSENCDFENKSFSRTDKSKTDRSKPQDAQVLVSDERNEVEEQE